MDDSIEFEERNRADALQMRADKELLAATRQWFELASRHRYSYHFKWMGRPIIQYPQDMIALQEIIWRVKPDLIVETGVARGGSLIFYASLLEMIGGNGRVVGIDIDIRKHNREAIESHPMAKRISLISGSSTHEDVVAQVREIVDKSERVLVVLDSNHTHTHALEELRSYSPFVKAGSYICVLDTVIEYLTEDDSADRPWGPGDNPMTAINEFLKTDHRFVVDSEFDDKLLITVAPGGYLRCIEDPTEVEGAES